MEKMNVNFFMKRVPQIPQNQINLFLLTPKIDLCVSNLINKINDI